MLIALDWDLKIHRLAFSLVQPVLHDLFKCIPFPRPFFSIPCIFFACITFSMALGTFMIPPLNK